MAEMTEADCAATTSYALLQRQQKLEHLAVPEAHDDSIWCLGSTGMAFFPLSFPFPTDSTVFSESQSWFRQFKQLVKQPKRGPCTEESALFCISVLCLPPCVGAFHFVGLLCCADSFEWDAAHNIQWPESSCWQCQIPRHGPGVLDASWSLGSTRRTDRTPQWWCDA